jgi:hypothetical protein
MKFVRLFILSLLLVGTVSHAQTIKEITRLPLSASPNTPSISHILIM